MFTAPLSVSFTHKVIGTWGDFTTPAGRVSYILTKARLGKMGTDPERRLTSQLRPVREVLDSRGLDFNQLLQRDLDDHRVATQLLPYLLKPNTTGPGFFPPIMAVLLPFAGKDPIDTFPPAETPSQIQDEGAPFLETRFGPSFAIRKLSAPEGGKPHPTLKLGQCLWNDEHAKLVVLDGQHRAMALLAVDRTLNQTWDQGSGSRFRHFYESRVQALLAERAGADASFLDNVEIPVVVCWFPSLPEPVPNAHRAARKLFVDVNKEARPPSEARLILLSDTELLNIFTRSMLNRLRRLHPPPPFPLYAIEYDNPEPDAARPVRWSVLANLGLLKFATQTTVFGPTKHIKNLQSRFGGRLAWSEMNDRLRQELEIISLFPETIEDGDRIIERGQIANDHFPLSSKDKLEERFMAGWGSAILSVLGKLLPYAAHCQALTHLEQEWIPDDAMSSLAKDAMFVGVGMYWTLRDSEQHWREHARKLQEEKRPIPPKPEIVKAWDVLQAKKIEFGIKRCFEYTGRTDVESVKDSNAFFDNTANTHACQLGALLTVATLANKLGYRVEKVAELAERLVSAWNDVLSSSVNKSRTRKYIFARDIIPNSLNRIRRLDTPYAVFFRYFWLELLLLPSALQKLEGLLTKKDLLLLVEDARTNYFRYLVDEQYKDLLSSHPNVRGKDKKLREKAEKIEADELWKALKFWFEANESDFTAWLNNTKGKSTTEEAIPEPEAVDIGAPAVSDPSAVVTLNTKPEDEDVDDLLRDAKPD